MIRRDFRYVIYETRVSVVLTNVVSLDDGVLVCSLATVGGLSSDGRDRDLSSTNKCDENGLHRPPISCSSNRVPLPAPRPSLMPSTIPCERKGQELLGTALR